MMEVARKLSRGCKRLYTLLPKKQVSVFIINQERMTSKGQFMVKDTMGGAAIKYATSARIEIKSDIKSFTNTPVAFSTISFCFILEVLVNVRGMSTQY